MGEGLENCRVLDREVRALGYQGSYSTVVQYVPPRRQHKQPEATMRFGTGPGKQAQVDWGSLPYIGEDGKRRRVWVFVMTLGWSRACYVELVRTADTAAFIQCHVNAFEYLGGVPRRCLYDNAKVVTLGRDEEKRPVWNRRMLDFALRVGFEARLCQPYRAQTKGKVESGVRYVRRNMWPSMRFTDDADLNRRDWSGATWWPTPDPRDDPPGPWGDAGRGAGPSGETAGPRHPGSVSQGGPEGGPGLLHQLGGLPLRRPLEMGGKDGAGGSAAGHGGDLVRH